MIDYSLILVKNYAGKNWILHGNSYDGLNWNDSSPKPTQEELDALWESTQEQANNEKIQAENTKSSALAKLAALGLTADEVKTLLG